MATVSNGTLYNDDGTVSAISVATPIIGGGGARIYTADDINNAVQIAVANQASETAVTTNSAIEVRGKEIAAQIINEQNRRTQIATALSRNGKIMSRFNIADDVIMNVKTRVSSPMWTDSTGLTDTGSLTKFFTSNDQPLTSRQYYIGVYNAVSSSLNSELQFSIAYGHLYGSGSIMTNGDSPSMAIYYQYRNILLVPGDKQFDIGRSNVNTVATSSAVNAIYVLSLARTRLKDKLDPGNWELVLSGSTSGLRLIDDSNSNESYTVGASGRIFNIVSGTIANLSSPSIYSPTSPVYYGLCYPDLGILVLDAHKVSGSCGINVTESINTTTTASGGWSLNAQNLFTAISGAADFAARNEEYITSTHYFVRVKNSEYNYSNNPSFVTGSLGDLRYIDFIDEPQVYITTIGLYNDRNELLAVAKLSKPLAKSFSTENLIKIRLDF